MFDQRINMPQMNEKNWMIIVAVVIVLIGSLIYNAYEEYRRHQQKDI